MSDERKPLVIDETFVTVPVSAGVTRAMRDWIAAHLADLEERLEPFGLKPRDITLPDWHRLVYVDDPLDCPACGYDPMAPHNGKGLCATNRPVGSRS